MEAPDRQHAPLDPSDTSICMVAAQHLKKRASAGQSYLKDIALAQSLRESGALNQEQFERLRDKAIASAETRDKSPVAFTATVNNICNVLKWDLRMRDRVRHNTLSGETMIVPLFCPKQQERAIERLDLLDLHSFLQSAYGMDLKTQNMISQAVEIEATRPGVAFNPLHDWLKDCRDKWERAGRPKMIDTWLVRFLSAISKVPGAEDVDDLIESVGARWLIGCIARAYRPGCKMDTVLILKGRQGSYKSTALSLLGGPNGNREFFGDSRLEKSKDAFLQIRGKWIYEMAELEGMKGYEATRIKNFLSSGVDTLRDPYGGKARDVKRTTVFCGTTNEDDGILQDETGNRRFWVVETGEIDLDALGKAVPLLWGEAHSRFEDGEVWHLDADREERFERLRKRYLETHPWEDAIREHLATVTETTTSKMLKHLASGNLGFSVLSTNRSHQMQCAGILRKLGWCSFKDERGRKVWRDE